jgi:hypothetical protein
LILGSPTALWTLSISFILFTNTTAENIMSRAAS